MDSLPSSDVNWRLFETADVLFAYQLAVGNDPRWWRVSRRGLAPESVVQVLSEYSAGVVIADRSGDVGIAALAEVGAAGTGLLEVWSLPDDGARKSVASVMVELIASVFGVSGIRCLYHERFDGDPWILGRTETLWRTEVTYPDFALVDGSYEARHIRVLQRDEFETTFFHPVGGLE